MAILDLSDASNLNFVCETDFSGFASLCKGIVMPTSKRAVNEAAQRAWIAVNAQNEFRIARKQVGVFVGSICDSMAKMRKCHDGCCNSCCKPFIIWASTLQYKK